MTHLQRRRQQVLLAQRAYRARSEANTKALQQRVARLESALERTGQSIISFTDILVGPHPPASYQQIAHHLRDTVKTCFNSAMDGVEGLEDVHSSLEVPNVSHISHAEFHQHTAERQTEVLDTPEDDHASPGFSPLPHISLLPSMPGNGSKIEIPMFVKHLRIACLYQGFLLLNNPSVPLEALRRPFRLLLPLVTRETITSYFHTRLNARMNNREPEPCSSIPYFGLGGAGTHYPNGTVQNYFEWESRSHDIPRVDGALSAFSPEVQRDLDGEWFDTFDLLGFLRAHGTGLSTTRPVDYTAHRMVNAVDFTAGESLPRRNYSYEPC